MPSSTPTLSLAAIMVAVITSPQSGTSFPISRIALEVRPMTAASQHYRTLPLHSSVDMPMRPMEEEKEKKKKNTKNNESDQKEWKQVVGGFVPKFLRKDSKFPTVEKVDTLQDYKRVVVDEEDRMVVVRFFAPWCKSCKASHPIFKKMTLEHSPNVKFVEVPLTKETAYIHEGLGVPSIPFGHIYHPDVGLVEEKKINKKVFKEFRAALDTYVVGSCDLPLDDEESVVEDGFQ